MINVDFYYKSDEKCPVREYLDSLSPKLRAKTLRSIMLLEEFGNELRLPYSSPLGEGIFELRSISGSDIKKKQRLIEQIII
ncbi:MAG: type II toxin-antitoxin system RelE/ParE family toxin [Lachnospiraceae bacterium]